MRFARPSVAVATLLVASVASLAAAGLLLGACGADTEAEEGDDGGLPDGSRRDAARADGGISEEETDGAVKKPIDVASCEALKAFYKACGGEPLCSLDNPQWDAWCVANTTSVDSEAYRIATARCATADNCGADKRKDCMYRAYADTLQSAAQQQLTTAFCQMCQPSDLAGCVKRTTTYNAAGGPGAVPSEFLAAWELSDSVVQKIRTACTGSGGKAWDGGADAGACARAFDLCAGDFYVEALTDCPR